MSNMGCSSHSVQITASRDYLLLLLIEERRMRGMDGGFRGNCGRISCCLIRHEEMEQFYANFMVLDSRHAERIDRDVASCSGHRTFPSFSLFQCLNSNTCAHVRKNERNIQWSPSIIHMSSDLVAVAGD